MTKYTKKKVNKLCRKWQKILRLQDWNIDVILTSDSEALRGSHGVCQSDIAKKNCFISIDCSDSNNNVHLTLVHELLHLHFLGFEPQALKDPDNKNSILTIEDYTDAYLKFDQGIELTAQALLRLFAKKNEGT